MKMPSKTNMLIRSWLPRTIDMKPLIFEPRNPCRSPSFDVRMWKLATRPRSTTASKNSPYIGSS